MTKEVPSVLLPALIDDPAGIMYTIARSKPGLLLVEQNGQVILLASRISSFEGARHTADNAHQRGYGIESPVLAQINLRCFKRDGADWIDQAITCNRHTLMVVGPVMDNGEDRYLMLQRATPDAKGRLAELNKVTDVAEQTT